MKTLQQHITEKLLINKDYKPAQNELVDDILMHFNIERVLDSNCDPRWRGTNSVLTQKDLNEIKSKLEEYIADAGYSDFDPKDVQYRIPRKQGNDLSAWIKRRYRTSSIIPNSIGATRIFTKGSFYIECFNKTGNPEINGTFMRICQCGPCGGIRWAELIKSV